MFDHNFKHNFQIRKTLFASNELVSRQLFNTSFTVQISQMILINNIRNIDNNILNLSDFKVSEVLLFGNFFKKKSNENGNFGNKKYIFGNKKYIFLNTTIEYTVSFKRFGSNSGSNS